jgi:excisionase family DNA binding protein
MGAHGRNWNSPKRRGSLSSSIGHVAVLSWIPHRQPCPNLWGMNNPRTMTPSPSSPMTRRLLDIGEVAIYTGLSVHTLYTMVSQRRIPFVKMGRLTKFDRYELDRWITAHSVKARKPFTVSTPLITGS